MLLLKLTGMARSTYYYHHSQSNLDDPLYQSISDVFHEHKGRYGYRRITLQLRKNGTLVNHKAVYARMKEMGLKSEVRTVKYRSYKGDVGKIAPNIINRNFKATSPDTKWTTDITQINLKGRKLYLSPILDMYNGEIISYEISEHPDVALVMRMLSTAFNGEHDTQGIVLHSDQGWQYQHVKYQETLKANGIIQSMSRKGNCLDNSIMENFFGVMKSELLYLQHFESIDDFRNKLEEYIYYYNNKRIKTTPKWHEPRGISIN